MKIFTGNFANIKKYKEAGLHPISIAISARYFTGQIYRPLNPRKDFMNDPEPGYVLLFNEILSKLSPVKVIEDLSELSNGNDVILLCHEGEGTFCHRRLVADWLKKELGIDIPELGKLQKPEQLKLIADLV